MKILHTSDLHIGHKLYENNTYEEFSLFTEMLINLINKEKIETVIISGDIFDVTFPSNRAFKEYYNFLMKLSDSFCNNVFIIAGNHDSAATIDAPKEILKHLNIYVTGELPEDYNKIIHTIKDKDKNISIITVPYLRDRDIRYSKPGETHEEKLTALKNGIAKIFSDTIEKANKTDVIIVTGHLFINGSKFSDSEREIQIGNLAGVSIKILPQDVDYYAFGHIHKAQIISKKPLAIYSGSPLPLSFNEAKYPKKVFITDTNNIKEIKEVEIPIFRELISFKGDFKSIKKNLNNYKFKNKTLKAFIELEISEENENPGLSNEIAEFVNDFNNNKEQTIIKHSLKIKNQNIDYTKIYSETESLEDLSVNDVFKKVLDFKNIEENKRNELLNTFKELTNYFNNN